MGAFSLWHWVIVVTLVAIFVWLPVRILSKAGYSGWWVLLSFLPLVNIAMVWLFAFADWPRLGAGSGPTDPISAAPRRRQSPHSRRT